VAQDHKIGGLAQEVYPQVLFPSYPSPLPSIEIKCMDSKICDDCPKCSKFLAGSYFWDAPVKIDVSQFFTYMGSKT